MEQMGDCGELEDYRVVERSIKTLGLIDSGAGGNSVWKSQDQKYVRPMRTETAVWSSVHPKLEFVMTNENRFGPVLTGFSAHKFSP